MSASSDYSIGPAGGEISVGLATDSAAALPLHMIEERRIGVAGMEIRIGDRSYMDGADLDTSEIYHVLDIERDSNVSTSAPKPVDWLEAIEKAASGVGSVLCITLSARMSASYDSARVARELARDALPSVDVRIFDSDAAAGSQALIVLEASRAISSGADIDSVVARADSVKRSVRLVAMLNTLDHIHRSGRLPSGLLWAAKKFKIKPVVSYGADGIRLVSKPMIRGLGMKRILREATIDAGSGAVHVNVMHVAAADEAARLEGEFRERFDCVELFTTEFHPFMGLHTGPGLVGAAWWSEDLDGGLVSP